MTKSVLEQIEDKIAEHRKVMTELKHWIKQLKAVAKLILRLDSNDYQSPLTDWRQKVVAYLESAGRPATRKEIIKATGVPPGSLSSVLRSGAFESAGRGLWRLRPGEKQC